MSNIQDLTEDQWQELLERLTHYALSKFRKCGWCRSRGNTAEWAAPGGDSPADLAFEAINRVLTGQREYDPASNPDFHDFMKSVVDSLVSHLVEKAVGHQTDRMPVRTDRESGEFMEVEMTGPARDPCDICIGGETVDLVRGIVHADASKDPLVPQLLECLEADIVKPAEVAEYLDVHVKEIYKAQKRLRRKIDQRFASGKERQR